jgi:hypothetical protein
MAFQILAANRFIIRNTLDKHSLVLYLILLFNYATYEIRKR